MPEFPRPLPVHARALDQDKENSAKKQDDGQDEARLQDEIEPEVLCEVKRRGQVLHISSHEIEKVDAVAHQADVGDDGLAEDCGGNPTSKGAEI